VITGHPKNQNPAVIHCYTKYTIVIYIYIYIYIYNQRTGQDPSDGTPYLAEIEIFPSWPKQNLLIHPTSPGHSEELRDSSAYEGTGSSKGRGEEKVEKRFGMTYKRSLDRKLSVPDSKGPLSCHNVSFSICYNIYLQVVIERVAVNYKTELPLRSLKLMYIIFKDEITTSLKINSVTRTNITKLIFLAKKSLFVLRTMR
jgi:hypothetical protein